MVGFEVCFPGFVLLFVSPMFPLVCALFLVCRALGFAESLFWPSFAIIAFLLLGYLCVLSVFFFGRCLFLLPFLIFFVYSHMGLMFICPDAFCSLRASDCSLRPIHLSCICVSFLRCISLFCTVILLLLSVSLYTCIFLVV